jgi:Na+/proline symporter
VDISTILLVLGVVVTLVACAGGAWAVLASDFVQMFLVMTITIVAAVLTLNLPQIGGIHGLVEKVQVPLSPAHWGALAHPYTVVLWALAISWMQIANSNNMENSVMYLMSKSDRDVRRMVLIPLVGSLIGPMIWLIPSLAATILHPNLGAEFPNLKQPHEAAFVAVCLQVMPQGLIGLMLCAMLGATITAMDASLNKGVSIFVRSFYLPMIDPNCPEKKLLIIGKIGTLVFGAIVVACALLVNQWRTANLFVLVNQVAGSLTIPLALPLFFGLFYKRTPAWSAWTTGLVGFIVAYAINFPLKESLLQWFGPLTGLERNNLMLAMAVFGTLIACGGWFFFTSLFYASSPQEHRDRVEKFFANLHTPIDARADKIQNYDQVIYRLIGGLCLVYGLFVLLLFFIPNKLSGRLCFVFIGGVIFSVGAVLFAVSKRLKRQMDSNPAADSDTGAGK